MVFSNYNRDVLGLISKYHFKRHCVSGVCVTPESHFSSDDQIWFNELELFLVALLVALK